MGTDPLLADTDGDGVPDNLDAYPLDPSRWEVTPPDPAIPRRRRFILKLRLTVAVP